MKNSVFLTLFVFFIMGLKLASYSQQTVLGNPAGMTNSAVPRDGVYDRSAINEVPPIPYPYLREADITWTKRIWRFIDLREKMNQPFYYPVKPDTRSNGRRSFAQIVLDGLQGVRSEKMSAYLPLDDKYDIPENYESVMDKYRDSTKMPIASKEPPYTPIITTIVKNLEASDVELLRIKEDYYFDRQRSVMEVRILGICLYKMDTTGGIRKPMPLFWIYFPDWRDIFAKEEMFNLKNGVAARLSYDDVFMKRIFSSYIMKEENVYDRQISQYASGKDALHEAEKAKNNLFDFESNLWEY
jgi:gliding motility associated protien GldN